MMRAASASRWSRHAFLVVFFMVTTEAGAQWLEVRDRDLEIRPGNALDFSRLVGDGPAGRHGRVIATKDGHLAFEKRPDQAQRFFCASQPYGVEEGFPDRETATRYARQLRMHGYNIARFHFLENVLMSGRDKDFDFDPEQLDRLHFFMAALKREGIYWMLDVMTSWNGAYGDVGTDRWADRRNVKLGVYLDESDRQHWRQLADRLLMLKNPYTGMSPLQDPALVSVTLVNEGGLNSLLNHRRSEELNRTFGKWLSAQGGQKGGDASMPAQLPHQEWHASPRMAAAQRFYYDMQQQTLGWMSAHLRKRGYQGLISSYDNWFTLQDIATRASLDLVTTHAYFDEPDGWVEPGSKILQKSSLPGQLAYVRELAASRYWGKPYAVTEYDQPFWNRYRFESGLAVGAYASLQDWDLICRHASGPIQLGYGSRPSARHRYLFPYAAGSDPVTRAAETLAALLFLRRDVSPSPHRLNIDLDAAYVFEDQAGIGFLPGDINRLGLVTGLGLRWRDKAAAITRRSKEDADAMTLVPAGAGNSLLQRMLMKARSSLGTGSGGIDGERWQAQLAQLRKAGVLDPANRSGGDILHSDTGEILLDTGAGNLLVSTPRTEAMAFDGKPPRHGRRLRVLAAEAPALLSVSALDDAPLERSARILLIYATDARNNGMEFADADERILRKLGGTPVRMRAARIRLQLQLMQAGDAGEWTLYALRLNGERASRVPFRPGENGFDIALDMAALPDGPTTFFELVREPASNPFGKK